MNSSVLSNIYLKLRKSRKLLRHFHKRISQTTLNVERKAELLTQIDKSVSQLLPKTNLLLNSLKSNSIKKEVLVQICCWRSMKIDTKSKKNIDIHPVHCVKFTIENA